MIIICSDKKTCELSGFSMVQIQLQFQCYVWGSPWGSVIGMAGRLHCHLLYGRQHGRGVLRKSRAYPSLSDLCVSLASFSVNLFTARAQEKDTKSSFCELHVSLATFAVKYFTAIRSTLQMALKLPYLVPIIKLKVFVHLANQSFHFPHLQEI